MGKCSKWQPKHLMYKFISQLVKFKRMSIVIIIIIIILKQNLRGQLFFLTKLGNVNNSIVLLLFEKNIIHFVFVKKM